MQQRLQQLSSVCYIEKLQVLHLLVTGWTKVVPEARVIFLECARDGEIGRPPDSITYAPDAQREFVIRYGAGGA